jgi:hypothetical protein
VLPHAVVMVIALVSFAPALPALGDEPTPIDSSREASRSLRFTGVVRVEWLDGDDHHIERLRVRSWNGTMVVEGARELVAANTARFVYHRGLGWAMVWPAQLGAADRPSPDAKYRIVARGAGATIAGRETKAYDVRRRNGVVCERLHVDSRSGLILRREQYGADGELRRVVTFESLDTSMATPVSIPAKVTDETPDVVPRMSPSSPYRAPTTLAGGYRLIGAYRRAGAVQLLYSDGIYDLSVFEQRGRLDRGDLPVGGTRMALTSGRDAWRAAWPGGEVVVWQAGGAVYTAVGEAPLPDVLAAARSMPNAGRSGLLERLRQACHSLFDMFSR